MAETRLIAVTNQKGGAGKTTTTLNVSGALNQRGHDVLVVDLDPQGHATEGFGFEDAYESDGLTMMDVLSELDHSEDLDELVRSHDEVDFVPAHEQMINAEDILQSVKRRDERLRMAFDALDRDYDYVVIDCPPNLGILVDNALLAAQNVLIPAQAKTTSIRALELLFRQIREMQNAFGVEIREQGLVANEVGTDNEAEEMMEWFEDIFYDRAPVFEIRKRVALQRAWNSGVSIFEHSEECDMEGVYLDIAEQLEEGW
jgi:chromosome partitioning protein